MKFVFRYTVRFDRSAASLFTMADLISLEDLLTENPEVGDVIPGGHGLRKVRVRAQGRGKQGGARVIYIRKVSSMIVLADCYSKKAKENLTQAEIETLIKETE